MNFRANQDRHGGRSHSPPRRHVGRPHSTLLRHGGHPRSRQSGISFGNLLMWFIVVGFGLMLGFKIGPLYVENRTIQSVMDSLKEEASLKGLLSPRDIRGFLDRRLLINGIRRFENPENVAIKRVGNKVIIDYEVREHMLANIDVVVVFNNIVELPNP